MKRSWLENINKAHDSMIVCLLEWFDKNKRDLPWRRDYEPYHVWISEIMLQQTQMERGVLYFNDWLEKFPTVLHVAQASEQEVLLAWEGLGYYSRARNLHKAAKIIVDDFGGEVPDDPAVLLGLPGIGEYTAGAIAAIAYQKDCIAVDANVERVFARIFDVAMPPKSPVAAGFIRQSADALLPEGKAREYAQSLMEFGALVCRKKPLCEECPLQRWCAAYGLGNVDQRPVKGKSVGITSLQVVTGILSHGGRVFIQKRLETGGWAGLWEFPGGRVESDEKNAEAIVRELQEETGFQVKAEEFLGTITHSYTRYKIALHCYLCRLDENAPLPSLTALHEGNHSPNEEEVEGKMHSLAKGVGMLAPQGQAREQGLRGRQPGPMSEHFFEGSFPLPELSAATAYAWETVDNLADYPFPAPHRRLLEKWGKRITLFTQQKISAES